MRVIELPAVIKSGESLAFILSGSKSELIAVAGGVFSPGFSAEFQLHLAVPLKTESVRDAGPEISALNLHPSGCHLS